MRLPWPVGFLLFLLLIPVVLGGDGLLQDGLILLIQFNLGIKSESGIQGKEVVTKIV